jgi:hypothetical protein
MNFDDEKFAAEKHSAGAIARLTGDSTGHRIRISVTSLRPGPDPDPDPAIENWI